MDKPLRLQKYLSDCGVCSRRAAEAAILAGQVSVNGGPAGLGMQIDPELDRVEYCGRPVRPSAGPKRYVMLNKPRDIVCTARDEKGRRPVTDLVPGSRLYPVGRLDMDSEGLLLLTDDGDFANRLTHPRHDIPKIYRVWLAEAPTAAQLAALSAPMTLDGYRLQPVTVQPRGAQELEMTLHEGRNRQIRRMCDAVGLRVTRLRRVAIGRLRLGDLPSGHWRNLTRQEVAYLLGEPAAPDRPPKS